MNIDEARALVSHAIEQRKRWNLSFTAKDLDGGPDVLLDALIVLREHGEDGSEIVKAHQDAGAAKARAAKWKKKLDEALEDTRAAQEELQTIRQELSDTRDTLRHKISEIHAWNQPV